MSTVTSLSDEGTSEVVFIGLVNACSIGMAIRTSLCLLLLACFHQQVPGIDATTCTDRADQDGFTNVMPMCMSGTLTADRVVVDTYDTGVLGYDSCHCTVRLAQAPTNAVAIQISGYTGTAPTFDCGSKLLIYKLPGNTFTEYRCQQILGDIVTFAANTIVNITLSKQDNNINWKSGYCLYVQTNVNINVDCVAPRMITRTSTTITTSTTTLHTGSSPIPIATGSTTGGDVNDDQVTEAPSRVEVIAGPAAGGVVFLIVIIIVIIIIIKKKRTDTKQTNDNFTVDIQPYAVASPRVYETDGTETLNHNPLYVSDGPGDPDTEHIVTQTGDMYAQVQKPTKNGNLETKQSRTSSSAAQVVTTPSGDVYAVVNKPKKQADDRKDEVAPEVQGGPSRYTNQEGLVYAEIDSTTNRPKYRPPLVKPKPKPEADRVIYSDVNTDVLL